jgi:hypothetical protein
VGQAAVSPRDQAFQRLAVADPQTAIRLRRQISELDDDELKTSSSINEAGLRIMGGVYDQASYEAAIRRGRELYRRFGLEDTAFDELPPQFSPEVVQQARMEAMEAKDQFAAVRADRKLEWEIEDDLLDNERADENLESIRGYREGQLSNTRRGQDLTDARGRRGQDLSSTDRRRGQDLTDTRGRQGQAMTDERGRRGQDMTDQRVRQSASFQGRGNRGRAGSAAPASIAEGTVIKHPQTGEQRVRRGGQWVPVK